MSTLICGSVAYDTIMVFPDTFRNHILPDKIHILNVCFLVPEMRKEFGGCATNIAYNLLLLGEESLPMATVGSDFEPYRKRLDELGIDRSHILQINSTFTAQAFITTDQDDNQIIAFHPGAMNYAQLNRIDAVQDVSLGIVSPDGKQAMIEHAHEFYRLGIPFVFDPGQGLPMFDANELKAFIKQADYVIVNDYESQLLQDKTRLSFNEIANQTKAFITTVGSKGSMIHVDGEIIEIPVAEISAAVDPTGCGDAYRAGVLYGLTHQLEWPLIGRIAALAGAIKIEHHGTQNHQFTRSDFAYRFKDNFGYSPW